MGRDFIDPCFSVSASFACPTSERPKRPAVAAFSSSEKFEDQLQIGSARQTSQNFVRKYLVKLGERRPRHFAALVCSSHFSAAEFSENHLAVEAAVPLVFAYALEVWAEFVVFG
jgi:hypothetical protein